MSDKSQKDSPQFVNPEGLEFNDPPEINWVLVDDVAGFLWVDNPKLHDMGSVIESIKRHGYQELPKFDANLPNVSGGDGAWKAGNGRIEALKWMQDDGGYELPRGLGQTEDGRWVCPGLFGTDAEGKAAAESYAIDSNNLTMLGGGFDPFDIARMWDEERYVGILGDLGRAGQLPVSVDGDVIDALLGGMMPFPPKMDDLRSEFGSDGPSERDFWPVIKATVSPDTARLWGDLMVAAGGEDEAESVSILLAAVDRAALGG